MKVRYPIVIETGDERSAFGDATLDAGGAIPPPSNLDDVRGNPDYAGWILGVIDVDPAMLDETVERVNITLPRRVLERLDAQARAAGTSRSGYIAELTLRERGPARRRASAG